LNTAGVRYPRPRALGARVRGAARRMRRLFDSARLPEATSPLDQWQRIPLNGAISARIESLGPSRLRAVEISGETHASRPWMEYTSLTYPGFDLCAPLGDRGTYDVVICEQVLEHIPDPLGAAANLRDLCEPGGQVIVSTPFLIRVHELPQYRLNDYWRFTPRGLRTLLESAGLEVDEVSSWGNRDCVIGNFDRWPAYRWWHSLRNEPDLPVQVWAFARRTR
jgi:SAM-dependent methyltransferase